MTTAFYHILADASTTPPPGGGVGSSFLIPLVCMGVILYFGMIRPQSKQRKDLAALVASLKTGDKVVTNGGIHGIISNVKEGNTLILKIADNVKIEIDKSAITNVEKASSPAVVAA